MKKNKENNINVETEGEKKSGVGIFLKEERERKGYSLNEIANILRIRRQYLDAIENEDWESIPSSILIKGFLRSYAKALKIDIKEVFDLYGNDRAYKEETPKPLVSPKKTKKKFIFVIFVLLCILIYALYLKLNNQPEVIDSKEKKDSTEIDEVVMYEDKSPEVNKKEVVTENANNTEPGDVGKTGSTEIVPSIQEPETEVIKERKKDEYSVIPDDSELENSISVPSTEVAKVRSSPIQPPDEPNQRLLLTGIVKMRTYVKIYIDNDPPKEYIFRPGSRPQWEARKGFDILIGNAAGIEFDFNGKVKKNLGGVGKVVRIRLPEDFEAGLYEE